MTQRTEYQDTCNVKNTESDQVILADVLNFNPGVYLSVSINRSVRVDLQWSDVAGCYVGTMAGLEFLSDGPDSVTYRDTRY